MKTKRKSTVLAAVMAVGVVDLLRVHHEKIEAGILQQAGVRFDAKAEPGKLRVVAS